VGAAEKDCYGLSEERICLGWKYLILK
jgi:hypothetical protein